MGNPAPGEVQRWDPVCCVLGEGRRGGWHVPGAPGAAAGLKTGSMLGTGAGRQAGRQAGRHAGRHLNSAAAALHFSLPACAVPAGAGLENKDLWSQQLVREQYPELKALRDAGGKEDEMVGAAAAAARVTIACCAAQAAHYSSKPGSQCSGLGSWVGQLGRAAGYSTAPPQRRAFLTKVRTACLPACLPACHPSCCPSPSLAAAAGDALHDQQAAVKPRPHPLLRPPAGGAAGRAHQRALPVQGRQPGHGAALRLPVAAAQAVGAARHPGRGG